MFTRAQLASLDELWYGSLSKAHNMFYSILPRTNRGKNMKFQSFIIQLNAQTGIAVLKE